MNPFRRVLSAVLALFVAVAAAACCGDCIKDPPCCKKAPAAAAPAPAPAPAPK